MTGDHLEPAFNFWTEVCWVERYITSQGPSGSQWYRSPKTGGLFLQRYLAIRDVITGIRCFCWKSWTSSHNADFLSKSWQKNFDVSCRWARSWMNIWMIIKSSKSHHRNHPKISKNQRFSHETVRLDITWSNESNAIKKRSSTYHKPIFFGLSSHVHILISMEKMASNPSARSESSRATWVGQAMFCFQQHQALCFGLHNWRFKGGNESGHESGNCAFCDIHREQKKPPNFLSFQGLPFREHLAGWKICRIIELGTFKIMGEIPPVEPRLQTWIIDIAISIIFSWEYDEHLKTCIGIWRCPGTHAIFWHDRLSPVQESDLTVVIFKDVPLKNWWWLGHPSEKY